MIQQPDILDDPVEAMVQRLYKSQFPSLLDRAVDIPVRVAKGAVEGVGSVGVGVGAMAKGAGRLLPDELAQYTDIAADPIIKGGQTVEGWAPRGDPSLDENILSQGAEAVGTSIPSLGLGLATGGAGAIPSLTALGLTSSFQEAGGGYDEALSRTVSPEHPHGDENAALKAAALTFPAGALDVVEGSQALRFLRKVGGKVETKAAASLLERLLTATDKLPLPGRMAISSGGEAIQETVQGGWEQFSQQLAGTFKSDEEAQSFLELARSNGAPAALSSAIIEAVLHYASGGILHARTRRRVVPEAPPRVNPDGSPAAPADLASLAPGAPGADLTGGQPSDRLSDQPLPTTRIDLPDEDTKASMAVLHDQPSIKAAGIEAEPHEAPANLQEHAAPLGMKVVGVRDPSGRALPMAGLYDEERKTAVIDLNAAPEEQLKALLRHEQVHFAKDNHPEAFKAFADAIEAAAPGWLEENAATREGAQRALTPGASERLTRPFGAAKPGNTEASVARGEQGPVLTPEGAHEESVAEGVQNIPTYLELYDQNPDLAVQIATYRPGVVRSMADMLVDLAYRLRIANNPSVSKQIKGLRNYIAANGTEFERTRLTPQAGARLALAVADIERAMRKATPAPAAQPKAFNLPSPDTMELPVPEEGVDFPKPDLPIKRKEPGTKLEEADYAESKAGPQIVAAIESLGRIEAELVKLRGQPDNRFRRRQIKRLEARAESARTAAEDLKAETRREQPKHVGDTVRLPTGETGTVVKVEGEHIRVNVSERSFGPVETTLGLAEKRVRTVSATDVELVEKPARKATPVEEPESSRNRGGSVEPEPVVGPARTQLPIQPRASNSPVLRSILGLARRQSRYKGNKSEALEKNAGVLTELSRQALQDVETVFDMYAGGGTYGLTYVASGATPNAKRLVVNEIDDSRRTKFQLAMKEGGEFLNEWDINRALIDLRAQAEPLIVNSSTPAATLLEKYEKTDAFRALSPRAQAAIYAIADVAHSGRTNGWEALRATAYDDAGRVKQLADKVRAKGVKIEVTAHKAESPEARKMVADAGRSLVIADPPYRATSNAGYTGENLGDAEHMKTWIGATKDASSGNVVVYHNSGHADVAPALRSAFGDKLYTREWSRNARGKSKADQVRETLAIYDDKGLDKKALDAAAGDTFTGRARLALPITLRDSQEYRDAFNASADEHQRRVDTGESAVRAAKSMLAAMPKAVHTDAERGARDALTKARNPQLRLALPIQPRKDQTQTEAFKRWFGESKVVDENGRPIVAYHGTGAPPFNEFFAKSMPGPEIAGWFSEDRFQASQYAGTADRGRVYPVYLRIENPRDLPREPKNKPLILWEQPVEGHDGVLITPFMPPGKRIWVAYNAEQVKSATGNTGAFERTKKDIRYALPIVPRRTLDELGFFSRVRETIESLPEQVKAGTAIAKLKANVSADELEWTGILNSLQEGKPDEKLSREALLKILERNDLKLVEVVRKQGLYSNTEEGFDKLANDMSEDERLWNRVLGRADGPAFEPWRSFATDDERYDYLVEEHQGWLMESITAGIIGSGKGTQHDEYQLPGGTNYREFVLLAPDVSPPFTHTHAFGDKNVVVWFRTNDRIVDGKKVLFVEEIQSDWHQRGRDRGYRDRNQHGQRFLAMQAATRAAQAIEQEMLTKWADSGVRPGPIPNPAYTLGKLDTLSANTSPEARGEIDADRARLQAAVDAEHEAAHAFHTQGGGVEDGPFKETWPELAMKRLLTIAAEGGYDTIAWTTGEQQIDRYNEALRQNVDKFEVEPRVERKPTVEVRTQALRDGSVAVQMRTPEHPRWFDHYTAENMDDALAMREKLLAKHSEARSGEKVYVRAWKDGTEVFGALVPLEGTTHLHGQDVYLEDITGKGIAKQIREKPTEAQTFEGEGLAIGGKGMQDFYDRMLPSIAKKLTKNEVGEMKFGSSTTSVNPGRFTERVQTHAPFTAHAVPIPVDAIKKEGFARMALPPPPRGKKPDINEFIRGDVKERYKRIGKGGSTVKRPLANPDPNLKARRLAEAVQEFRLDTVNEKHTRERGLAELAELNAKDPEGVEVLRKMLAGEGLSSVGEILQAQEIKRRDLNRATKTWDDEDLTRAIAVEYHYDEGRALDSARLRAARDFFTSKQDRFLSTLAGITKAGREAMRKAKTQAQKEKIIQGELAKMRKARLALLRAGFDVTKLTEDYYKDDATYNRMADIAERAKGNNWDWYYAWRAAAMQAGPLGAVVNPVSNFGHIMWDNVLPKAFSSLPNETKDYLSDMVSAVPDALKLGYSAWRYGQWDNTSVDEQLRHAPTDFNLLGLHIPTGLRYVELVSTNVNAGQDAFFRHIVARAELGAAARALANADTAPMEASLARINAKLAKETNKKKIALLKAEAKDLDIRIGLAGMTVDHLMSAPVLIEQAQEAGRKAVFGDRDRFTRALNAGREILDYNGFSPGRIVVPFLPTPAKIMQATFETAGGPIVPGAKLATSAMGLHEMSRDQRLREMGKLLVGLGLWAMVHALANKKRDDGLPWITGSREEGKAGQQQLRTAPPYSFTNPITGNYISYQRFDPFGTALPIMLDVLRGKNVLKSTAETIKDKTFFRGIQELYVAATDERHGRLGTWARNTLWQPMVPNFIRSSAPRTEDGTTFEVPRSNADTLEPKDLLYATTGLKAFAPPLKYDRWGRPVAKAGRSWFARMFYLFPATREESEIEPIDLLIERYRDAAGKPVVFGAPDMKFQRFGQTVEMTEEEYSVLAHESGLMAIEKLRPWAAGKKELTDADVKHIHAVIESSEKVVKDRIARDLSINGPKPKNLIPRNR